MLNKRDIIIQLFQKNKQVTSEDVVKKLKVTRVYASRLLSSLVADGKLFQVGKTRGSFYVLSKDRELFSSKQFHKTFPRLGLREDEIYDQLHQYMPHDLKKNVEGILKYAFTEMLNNAIDHSQSSRITVDFTADSQQISFIILDRGIGIFNKLKTKFHLKDHYEALQRVLKGKQTTDPKRHSGQGIFFTSKVADRFEIFSSKLHLIIDNTLPDLFVEEISPLKGTKVVFTIKSKSDRSLKAIFDQYTDKDFRFSKTQTIVELYKQDDSYVSRSQAKKLLMNLEGFDTIILDFKKVKLVGQGFADEVFRVYQQQRPKVELIAIHMEPTVEFMVQRAMVDGRNTLRKEGE